MLYLILTLFYTSRSQSDFFTCQHSSQILDDSMASWKDDGIEAVDVQLGQVLHLCHSLSVTEAGCLHHHVPAGMDRIHHKVHPRNHRQSQNAHCAHLRGPPVLSRGRLLSHVVNHVHLLLIWSKHLEAGAVTAQVVHGAEDERGALPSACVNSVMCISWPQQEWYSLNPFMDISTVPPSTSWENLKHMDSPNHNYTHTGSAPFSQTDLHHLPLQR